MSKKDPSKSTEKPMLELKYEFVGETKHKVKYVSDEEDAPLGVHTLYLSKDAMANWKSPEQSKKDDYPKSLVLYASLSPA